jgi:hypothetical protein
MGVQKEEAVIDVTVNKKAAQLNIQEFDAEIKQLTGRLREMHRELDPQQYDRMVRSLNIAREARQAELDVINGGTIALQKFKQEFINGQRTVEVAAANNPVKKYAIEARTAFESLNNTVRQTPIRQQISDVRGLLSGSEISSSPFFNYITTGFRTAYTSAQDYKSGLQLQREAILENKEAQLQLQAALAATTTEQEAVNAQLLINRAAQAESTAAVAAATAIDEAKAAALAHEKLVQEEVILTTRAQALAENQATIATEAQTVAIEAQTMATGLGSGALRVFKIALASTGIGLLIVAIASLVAYFAETNEGSKKLKVVMAQLNALFQECMKLIAPIGKAIFNTFTDSNGPIVLFTALLRNAMLPLATLFKVFSDLKNGNFKQAFLDIKSAMASWADNNVDIAIGLYTTTKDLATNLSKASDEIKKADTGFAAAAKNAKAIAQERQKLVDVERDWTVEKTKQMGAVDLLSKKLYNQNLTEEQRLAIGEKAKAMRLAVYKTDLEYAKKNEDLVIREQALNSKKDLQAIADAKKRTQEVTNLYNAQYQTLTNQSIISSRVSNQDKANKDAYAKLIAIAQQFNKDAEVDQRSANDKEIAAAEKKYDGLIEALNEYKKRKGVKAEDIAKAEDFIDIVTLQKWGNVNELREKQEAALADKIKGFHQQITDVHATELQKQTDKINAFYDAEVIAAGKNANQIKLIEQARQADLNTTELQEAQRLQDEIQKIKEEGAVTDEDKQKIKLEKITQHYDAELETLKKDFSKKLQATQEFKDAEALILGNKTKALKVAVEEDPAEVKKAKTAVDKRKKDSELEKKAMEETSKSLSTIMERNRHTETDNTLRSLEARAQLELNTGHKTAAQKQAIQDKLAKDEARVKLAAWKADQTAAIEMALINGALAMTKVAAQTGVLSFAFDPIIAIQTAAEIAMIASQPEPKFLEKGGKMMGPSHSAGGIPLVDGNTGRQIAEVEGDETVAVFSKESTKNNGWLINQLLFSSMYKNGAKVDVGGISNGVKLEKGGPLALSAAGMSSSSSAEYHQHFDTAGIIAEQRATRQAIIDQKVILSRSVLDDFDKDEAEIRRRATV